MVLLTKLERGLTLGIISVLNLPELLARGVPATRLQVRRDGAARGGEYVLYWMQASQRERCNPALETAAALANALGLPLLVGIVLVDNYPQAVRRHYRFMAEGWETLAESLRKRGIGFRVVAGESAGGVRELAGGASAVVCDVGYTRFQEEWRHKAESALACPLLQVESDVVVPVQIASPKEEYAARTIRPKVNRQLAAHLLPLKRIRLREAFSGNLPAQDFSVDKILGKIRFAHPELPASPFRGGETEAARILKAFLRRGAEAYGNGRNDPGAEATSTLSPYLHFGQISPVDIALQAINAWGREAAEPLLEQLIVRRELAMNFVYYNDDYDSPECLPDWAVRTLDRHASDRREYCYSYEELFEAKTHDPAWNAAQKQMTQTGHMAGYMRMYWGKKVLEWSRDWREAYRTLVRLNDTCELDGRDPNGYAGIAWIFGKHDRPWGERPIFGTIRYMNEAGLKRKFDVSRYIGLAETAGWF
jgi:deoxyribodipyrimidine photo-lyase